MAETDMSGESKKVTQSINPLHMLQSTYGIWMSLQMFTNAIKQHGQKAKTKRSIQDKVPTFDEYKKAQEAFLDAQKHDLATLEKSIEEHIKALEKGGVTLTEADKAAIRAPHAKQIGLIEDQIKACQKNIREADSIGPEKWEEMKRDPQNMEWANQIEQQMTYPEGTFMDTTAFITKRQKEITAQLEDPTLDPVKREALLQEQKIYVDNHPKRQELFEQRWDPEKGLTYNGEPWTKSSVMKTYLLELKELHGAEITEADKAYGRLLGDVDKELDEMEQLQLGLNDEDYKRYKEIKALKDNRMELSTQDKVDWYEINEKVNNEHELDEGFKEREAELKAAKAELESQMTKEKLDEIRGPLVSDITFDVIDKNVLMMKMATGANVAKLAEMAEKNPEALKAAAIAGKQMWDRMPPDMKEKMLATTLNEAKKEFAEAMQSPEKAQEYFGNITKAREGIEKACSELNDGQYLSDQEMKDFLDCKDPAFGTLTPEQQQAARIERARLKKDFDALEQEQHDMGDILKEWNDPDLRIGDNIKVPIDKAAISREDYIKQKMEELDPEGKLPAKESQAYEKAFGKDYDKAREDYINQKMLEVDPRGEMEPRVERTQREAFGKDYDNGYEQRSWREHLEEKRKEKAKDRGGDESLLQDKFVQTEADQLKARADAALVEGKKPTKEFKSLNDLAAQVDEKNLEVVPGISEKVQEQYRAENGLTHEYLAEFNVDNGGQTPGRESVRLTVLKPANDVGRARNDFMQELKNTHNITNEQQLNAARQAGKLDGMSDQAFSAASKLFQGAVTVPKPNLSAPAPGPIQ